MRNPFDRAERWVFLFFIGNFLQILKDLMLSIIYLFLTHKWHFIEQTIYLGQIFEQIIVLQRKHTPPPPVLSGRPLD